MFRVTLNLDDYPDDELQALRSEAARRGLSLGHLAREILLQYAATPAPASSPSPNPNHTQKRRTHSSIHPK